MNRQDADLNRKDAKQSKRIPREIEDLATQVIGVAIEVHKQLGPGYLESVYEEAMTVEMELRRIPYERQVRFALDCKGREVGCGCVDLLAGRSLVVELKTVEAFAPIHMAQVISYLRAMRKPLGLLINFHQALVADGIKRVVLT